MRGQSPRRKWNAMRSPPNVGDEAGTSVARRSGSVFLAAWSQGLGRSAACSAAERPWCRSRFAAPSTNLAFASRSYLEHPGPQRSARHDGRLQSASSARRRQS